MKNSKFKAAVLIENKSKIKIEKLDLKRPDKGQVLIKINYTSVCKSQIYEIDGLRGKDKWLPHMLGHEAVATVILTGSDVKGFKKNDRVIVTWIKTFGKDTKKKIFFKSKNKIINAGKCTTFSEYSLVSENRLFKLPKKIPKKFGSLFGCAFPTGMGLVKNCIKPRKNKTFIIYGLGGIGLSALLAIKSYSPKLIVVIDRNQKRKKLAIDAGADIFLSSQKNNLEKVTKDLNNNSFYDYCIESTGFTNSIEKAFKLIKNNNGKLVFASHPEYNKKIRLNPHELIQGKIIRGTWGGQVNFKRDIKFFVDVFLKNKNFIKKYFCDFYTFRDINKAINDLRTGKSLRPIIKIG